MCICCFFSIFYLNLNDTRIVECRVPETREFAESGCVGAAGTNMFVCYSFAIAAMLEPF